ncbi:MAG TPA: hypothetical protein DCO93_00510, partial [Clostridiales bacterium]|nr:hypothetical protein [Clostridiales bacterium]
KGDKGDKGEPGEKGETGATGAKGEPGEKGDKGDKGDTGEDGFSPSVKVTQTPSGATISITDKTGMTTATVSNGATGEKGDKGDKGDTGAAGYTPQKGIDYFTSADIAEIAQNFEPTATKQDILVSGENIKTVNGESILGRGNLNPTRQIEIDLMLSGILARNSALLTGDISSNVLSVAELEGINDTSMNITSLSLPNTVNIGRYSFFNTRNLRNLNAPKVTTIEAYAFQYLGYNVNEGEFEVDLPELKTTGYQAFFINRVTRINVPKLESLNFGVFWRSPRLQTVNLPAVTSIAAMAFSECANLAEITLGSNSVVTLSNINAFGGTPYDVNGVGGIIYVPQSLISAYESATNWSSLNCTFLPIDGE